VIRPIGAIITRERLPLTAALVTLIALAAFNTLAVVGGLPQITADLGQVGLLGWLVTGFLVTSTLATMMAGPLIDALGVRRTFRVTIVVFAVGSVACAVAPNMTALVAFRAVQGAGAGLALAVATAAIGLGFPEGLRPRIMTATSVTWGVMALAGPALAAALVTTTGWRGIFLANLPLAGLAAILGWARLPPPSPHATEEQLKSQALGDRTGIVLLGAFTVVSLVGVSNLTPAAAVAAAVAALLAAVYWIYSGRVARPVLARRHFAGMPLGAINLCFGLAFGAALGIDAYLPIYVRGGLRGSEALAAFSVAFLTIGWTAGSVVTARLLDRLTETVVALVGFGLLIPPLVVGLIVYDAETAVGVVLAMAWIIGMGVGTLSMAMLNLLFSRSDPAEVGRASAAHQYIRGLFQTYAAAMVGAILLLVVRSRIGDVEPVQRLLAGEPASGADLSEAVAMGFRMAHVVPLVFAVGGAVIAVLLHRREGRAGDRAGGRLVREPPTEPTRATTELEGFPPM
jgi:MFS family permease